MMASVPAETPAGQQGSWRRAFFWLTSIRTRLFLAFSISALATILACAISVVLFARIGELFDATVASGVRRFGSTVRLQEEAVQQWRDGKLRPLCVFDSKVMNYTDKIADGKSWHDIPTCKDAGLDVQYLMLRGIFTTPGASADEVGWYVDLFKKMRATAGWQDFMKEGAFDPSFKAGDDYKAWLTEAAATHRQLMEKAGFLSAK